MSSHGKTSFYELAKEIVFLLDLEDKIKVIPINSSKFSEKERAKRPSSVIMQNKRLKNEGFDYQRSWKEGLKEYLSHEYYKNLFE